jgi:membrane-bound ClpP family serine protease
MQTLLWVGTLLLVGLAVMVLEVFVPSGGALGLLSLVAIGAAIVMAFMEQGPGFGMAVLAVAFAAVPAVLAMAFRWFPDTPLGRRVLPPPPAPEDVIPAADRRRRLRQLVGRVGQVVSELVPWGAVAVGDGQFEAVSETGPVAAGMEVEVVGVQGGALVVRAAPRPVAAEPLRPEAAEKPDSAPHPRLSQVLEEFEFDALDRPQS